MNVVEVKTRKVEVQESVVELLERYLERAKSGELTAVGIAAVTDDGSALTDSSHHDCAPSLIGAATILQARLVENRHGH